MDTCIYRPHRQLAASSFIIRSQETNSRTIVNYNELGEMTVREFKDKVWGFQTEIGDLWNIYHFEVCVFFIESSLFFLDLGFLV